MSSRTARLWGFLLAASLAQPAFGQDVPARSGALPMPAFADYSATGSVGTSGGAIRLDDAPSYGAAIGFEVRPRTNLELTWIYSGTHAQFVSNSASYPSSSPFNVAMNYLQAGGTVGFLDGPVKPVISGSLGTAVYVPASVNLANGQTLPAATTWRLAFMLGGGLEYFFTKLVGLGFDARLLAPVYFGSSSFYSAVGGAALAVNGGIPFVEACFTGGLVIST